MIVIRQMAKEELSPGRIAEIDVSESGGIVYRYADGDINSTSEVWHRPRWDSEKCTNLSEGWFAQSLRGDVILGAFDEDLLVGISILRYELTDSMAQLDALFVSRHYRRRGIAARLTQEIIRLAKESGARELYVSATPSESAVGFYKSQGFRLAERVNKELYALEPKDIHMIRQL